MPRNGPLYREDKRPPHRFRYFTILVPHTVLLPICVTASSQGFSRKADQYDLCECVNVNVNLYSTLGSNEVLSIVLYSDWFILVKTQLLSFCHSFILRRSHLLRDQPLESIQVCHLMLVSASLSLPSEPHIYSPPCTNTHIW